jgi:hypothetical protein
MLTLLLTPWLAACGPPAATPAPPTLSQGVEEATLPASRPPATASPTAAPPATQGGPAAQPATPAPEADVPVQAQAVARLAVQDLAQRQGVEPGAVRVLSVEAVEWPDASLGCPQPGMMYAQVITPGYRLVLEAGGQTYEYHTDQDRFAVLCEKETAGAGEEASVPPEPTLAGPQDALLNRMAVQATEDLARRLAVSTELVDLLEVRQVTWPDAGLGCPRAGTTYAQVTQDGVLIRLRAAGQMYFYHAALSGEPFLCEETTALFHITPEAGRYLPPPESPID